MTQPPGKLPVMRWISVNMNEFKLERYFARYEFKADYLLSSSDCESLSLSELLEMADREALRLWENLTLGYTESPGHPLLRSEIAALYDRINADQVVVAAPEEAIFLAMHAILRRGDQVICLFPAYQSLYEVAASLGSHVIRWELRPEQGRWRIDMQFLKDQLTAKTRLIVINFPHNPTGFYPSREELEEIILLARERGIFIFSDEMYRFLEYETTSRLPAVCDVYENGISLFGLSKTFSLPGLRLGWVASPRAALLQEILWRKDYTTICNNAPGEILGIIALRAKRNIIARNLQIIRHNLKSAELFFGEYADWFHWLPPRGGSTAFPRLLLKKPVADFCAAVIDRQNLMILPGNVFEFPGNHFRVGLGRRNFPQALKRLRVHLKQTPPVSYH